MSTAREWVRSFTDVREGEFKVVGLMLLYGFLALTSYYVVKPARNAVFVERLGADNLPYVYILTAVVVSLVMVVYSRYVHRIGHLTLLLGTFAFLASNLVAFRWLLLEESLLASGAFYIWGKLYPLLLVSQFWLVGNLLFTTRQAKRLFGLIGVGLILGGIAGSSIAGWSTEVLGTENLLLLAIGILGLCALIVVALRPEMASGAEEEGRLVGKVSADALRLLKDSTHLRTIALILGLTIVVSTLVDWQFNRAVELFISGEDAKTSFYGRFFMVLNIVSVAIQIFFTGFVLRTFGVGVGMLVLPAGLLLASVGVLAVPLLLTAALAKGTEGALRYSLDQSTRELLYLPVALDVKYKVKPLIDLAVYRGGTGLGGLLLLVATNWLGGGMRTVSVVAAALIVGWVLATLRMRREFKDSVKRLIGVRDVDVSELIGQRLDEDVLDELRGAMQSGDDEQVLYGLELVSHRDPRLFAAELRSLLQRESPELRARSLRLLTEIGDRRSVPEARTMLVDPDLDVRVAAMEHVLRNGTDDPEEELRTFLEDDAFGIRAAAIAVILRSGGRPEDDTETDALGTRELAEEALETLSEEEDLEARRFAARLLVDADLTSDPGRRVLDLLLEDPDDPVRHAALQAAGRVEGGELAPLLLERLEDPVDRPAAVKGLAGALPSVRDPLVEQLRDAEAPMAVREAIPRAFLPAADQETVTALFESLEDAPPTVRFEILKTLDKLRRDREELTFEEYDLDSVVRLEAEEAHRWAVRYRVIRTEEGEDTFLAHLLEQRMEEAVERAFRALGLQHSVEDLQAAFVALRSEDPLMRQRGFELMDNAVPREYRDLFDPLVNPEADWEERLEAARERYGEEAGFREEVLRELSPDEDLCVSALARAGLGEPVEEREVTAELLRRGLSPGVRKVVVESLEDEEVDVMDVLERADMLRRTSVFRGLRGQELAGIAALMDERRSEKGERISLASGTDSELYVVVRGRLGARQDGDILYDAEPGETFIDPAFLDGREPEIEVVALEDTHLLSIRRADFDRLMEERFPVVQGLLAHLGGLIRKE